VDWWDECRASQDGPPYWNKTQKSLTVSTPKTISPQAWGTWGLMPIINSLKQQGLLTSCSSPYNKFKTLIKVKFKIQVTKKTTGKDIDRYWMYFLRS
jgi:hypothetical protein